MLLLLATLAPAAAAPSRPLVKTALEEVHRYLTEALALQERRGRQERLGDLATNPFYTRAIGALEATERALSRANPEARQPEGVVRRMESLRRGYRAWKAFEGRIDPVYVAAVVSNATAVEEAGRQKARVTQEYEAAPPSTPQKDELYRRYQEAWAEESRLLREGEALHGQIHDEVGSVVFFRAIDDVPESTH